MYIKHDRYYASWRWWWCVAAADAIYVTRIWWSIRAPYRYMRIVCAIHKYYTFTLRVSVVFMKAEIMRISSHFTCIIVSDICSMNIRIKKVWNTLCIYRSWFEIIVFRENISEYTENHLLNRKKRLKWDTSGYLLTYLLYSILRCAPLRRFILFLLVDQQSGCKRIIVFLFPVLLKKEWLSLLCVANIPTRSIIMVISFIVVDFSAYFFESLVLLQWSTRNYNLNCYT